MYSNRHFAVDASSCSCSARDHAPRRRPTRSRPRDGRDRSAGQSGRGARPARPAGVHIFEQPRALLSTRTSRRRRGQLNSRVPTGRIRHSHRLSTTYDNRVHPTNLAGARAAHPRHRTTSELGARTASVCCHERRDGCGVPSRSRRSRLHFPSLPLPSAVFCDHDVVCRSSVLVAPRSTTRSPVENQ